MDSPDIRLMYFANVIKDLISYIMMLHFSDRNETKSTRSGRKKSCIIRAVSISLQTVIKIKTKPNLAYTNKSSR